MAIGAVLLGSLLGFASFWIALFGFGYGFLASIGVYMSVGLLSSIMLIARAALMSHEANAQALRPATPDETSQNRMGFPNQSQVNAARGSNRIRVASKTTA